MKKTILLSLLALVILACSWSLWAASARSLQDFKPIAVATVSSYDEIKGDVAFLGKISENPYLADGLEAMLNLMTNSQGLAGLDKSRPSGLVVETNGRELLG